MARIAVVVPGHRPTKISLAGVSDETDLVKAVVAELRDWLSKDVAHRARGDTIVLHRIAAASVAAFSGGDAPGVERSEIPAVNELTAADAILAVLPAGGEYQSRRGAPK